MRSLAHTSFSAVFQAEILLNSKRVVPYALMLLFSGNAVLWWIGGPAVSRGWATNSDFYIARLFGGFSFMTLPLFIALLMGDPVVRDYRAGVDALIFSKPVSRAEYLMGKFFGNFFVLVCCQSCFALTSGLLQAFRPSGMIVLPARVVPYVTQFLFFVVISSLLPAAICFTVGTLTRNVKIVYGLATSFYLLYLTGQIAMKGLPMRWRIILDPILFNWIEAYKGRDADFLNQLTLTFDGDMTANRALVLVASSACLAILCARFSIVERPGKNSSITAINLVTNPGRIVVEPESFATARLTRVAEAAPENRVAIPAADVVTEGVSASLTQLLAALGVEIRLLSAERSLVVLVPLGILMCVAGLAYYEVVPDGSYSAAYAGRAAESLLLFLSAVAVFYTGEAMHRDRELRVEPILWAAPTPNFVLLLSKFAATLLLAIFLCLAVGLTSVALQIYKGHTPVEIPAYLTIGSVILIPDLIFLVAAATALQVLLRDKHLAYAASLAAGGGLFYLFSSGYNHWLYNPLLYQLWTPSDLTGEASRLTIIITLRIYCFAIAIILLALAHLFFERKLTGGLRTRGGRWSILILVISAAVAVIAGFMIAARR